MTRASVDRRLLAALRPVVLAFVAIAITVGTSVVSATAAAAAAAATAATMPPGTVAPCAEDPVTDAVTGAHASASAIGWAGNAAGVTTCLGGSFHVQDGIDQTFGFGIYHGGPTRWVDADGYLPAQVTTFGRGGASMAITEFADQVTVEGNSFVAVYARVAVTDSTGHHVVVDPDPSPGLIPLGATGNSVAPHTTADHDYVVAVDRFGHTYPWPPGSALAAAGGFARHFAHMRAFWNDQLSGIAEVHLPDRQLDNAYRSGFITTEITRSGTHLDTGVNGYQAEFSHDVIGILANLFTQGDYADAHALLLEARDVVGSQGQYEDAVWTYSWPWAVYLMKTGDLAFVKANFSTPGPGGGSQPSIEETAHQIAADRTGPGGIIGATDDIDTDGYWTVDDYEALTGLAAYHYLAQRVGNGAEVAWSAQQYAHLLAVVNLTLDATIRHYHLDYLPCSMVQPNTANRCDDPEDANWAAPFLFGRWAWDAPLFGAAVNGPGLQLIDATYAYGFGRLRGRLPAGTFGGYPSDYYTTAYNAGYGSWGLAGSHYRDQGIVGYQFMIDHGQSGPYSWWESASAPPATSPWVGTHPAAGQGSSPHAWGMANANKVLLDSLVAEASNGTLVVGRGVPSSWVTSGRGLSVTDFPTVDGRRLSVTVAGTSNGVTLSLRGSRPMGPVLFELPLFVDNIASATAGHVDQKAGVVRLPAGATAVTVMLRHRPS